MALTQSSCDVAQFLGEYQMRSSGKVREQLEACRDRNGPRPISASVDLHRLRSVASAEDILCRVPGATLVSLPRDSFAPGYGCVDAFGVSLGSKPIEIG